MATRFHLCLIVLVMGCSSAAQDPEAVRSTIDPVDESLVETTIVSEGVTYKLYRGDIYRVSKRTGKWEFVVQGYDPNFYKENYVEKDDAIFRKGPDGKLYAVKFFFSDDFENARTIGDLIGIERGWTAFTLQSPKAPTVPDYVRLRKRILEKGDGYLDNRVEPTGEIAHSGQGALKTYSVPRIPQLITHKASLETELLHFVRGDDVWFSGWYYVPKSSGMPTTLMDLETTWFKEHPGIRIFMFGEGYAGFELKWGSKPTYRQARGKEIPFPRDRWVHLAYHLTLSEKQDGVVQLWQDGKRIVDARGQTLPLEHTIYNSLEVGLSAYSRTERPATLYVDDIMIANSLNRSDRLAAVFEAVEQ